MRCTTNRDSNKMQLKGQLSFFNFIHYGIPFLKSFCYRLLFKSFFGAFGKGTILISPRIKNPRHIYIGNNCRINDKVWLASLGSSSKLIIGDRVRIGRFSEIYAIQSITIEEGVVMAEILIFRITRIRMTMLIFLLEIKILHR